MNSQFLSDRELVELAADSIKTCVVGWNSLEKKSDALELLIELELNIRHEAWSVVVERFIPTVSVTTAITIGLSNSSIPRASSKSRPKMKQHPTNGWFSATEFMRCVKAMHTVCTTNHVHWLDHIRCKYVNIYVDQRTGDFILKDREGVVLDVDTVYKLYPELKD